MNKEKWKPRIFDYYYYIYIQDNKLQITSISFEDTFFDRQLIENGNCFKTIQEAGKALELIKKGARNEERV